MGSAGSTSTVIMVIRIDFQALTHVSTVSTNAAPGILIQPLISTIELDLPEYESYEDLRLRLHKAMTAGGDYFGFA